MFKVDKGMSPACIKSLFKTNADTHGHDTRGKFNLYAQKGNHEYVYKTFVYQSIYLWNAITQNLNIKTSINIFKNNLKAFLTSSKFSLRYPK